MPTLEPGNSGVDAEGIHICSRGYYLPFGVEEGVKKVVSIGNMDAKWGKKAVKGAIVGIFISFFIATRRGRWGEVGGSGVGAVGTQNEQGKAGHSSYLLPTNALIHVQ